MRTILLVSIIITFSSCENRKVKYSGLNDLVVGVQQIVLYENGEFYLELGAGGIEGNYEIKNDTILLHYKDKPEGLLITDHYFLTIKDEEHRKPVKINRLDEGNYVRVQKMVSKPADKRLYSAEFLKHFQKNIEITLKGDSILFPEEADSAIVLIPEYIPKNQDIRFVTENGHSMTLRQINYTDLAFEIQYDRQKFKGNASLKPRFYLGMETVEFADGEYIITHYYVTETDNPCLNFIGLGNQNIAEEGSENVYALVSVSGNTCEDELKEMAYKKLKPVS
jgi:hypothetical protein